MVEVTNSRELVFGERRVTVRELTVGDIRNWLVDLNGEPTIDLVDGLLFDEVTLQDLERMTSLARAEMDQWRPSDLRSLIEQAKEMNPDFFALRERMVKVHRATGSET